MNLPSLITNVSVKAFSIAECLMAVRALEATESSRATFSTLREISFSSQLDRDDLFDRLAGLETWSACRPDIHTIYVSSGHCFIEGRATSSRSHTSFQFEIWAESRAKGEEAEAFITQLAGGAQLHVTVFTVRWFYSSGQGESIYTTIEEIASDILLDEAYPTLEHGVDRFIDDYLDSESAVLVLQGPPGTGKTRLIRKLMGSITRRKGIPAHVMYTGDDRVLQGDAFFSRFLTSDDDALIIEDADHLLRPRSDGNDQLHRFLAIADGLVRPQGRKVVFSTNLPNVGDLDEALVRPGRCFAHVELRRLDLTEAERLLRRLTTHRHDRMLLDIQALKQPSLSLADLYLYANDAERSAQHESPRTRCHTNHKFRASTHGDECICNS